MEKISLQMYTMRERTKTIDDLKKTVQKLSEIGFDTLQYTIPESFHAKEVKSIFDEFGIKNDSVFCPHLKIEEKMETILSQCSLFETKYVRTDSITAGLTEYAAGYKAFAHYLNEAAKPFSKHGIKLLYHFHAFEFKRFGDKTGIDIILSETDPEYIQIIPDTHWIHSGGKNVVEFLEKYKDRYDYIHAKDFGIGVNRDILESRPIEICPVGEGNLNWKPIIEFCKSKGVLSYAIEQDCCYGRDEFECVKSSYDFLKKMGVGDK